MRYSIISRSAGPRLLVVEQNDGSQSFHREAEDIQGRKYWLPVELRDRDQAATALDVLVELALGDATAQVGP